MYISVVIVLVYCKREYLVNSNTKPYGTYVRVIILVYLIPNVRTYIFSDICTYNILVYYEKYDINLYQHNNLYIHMYGTYVW